jgi:hypothetical protein
MSKYNFAFSLLTYKDTQDVAVVICCNKSDADKSEWEISDKEGSILAQQYEMPFIVTRFKIKSKSFCLCKVLKNE